MQAEKRKVIFRADGNSQIGLGHVIRSLALADMLPKDYTRTFAIREPSETLKTQINQVCDQVFELPSAANDMDEVKWLVHSVVRSGDIVVLDGYHFTTDYQRIIKNNGNGLICIDDLYLNHFVADAIINHAGGVEPSNYSVEPYTKLYLGPAFALLRQPFLEAAKCIPQRVDTHQAFINMGGADPHNHTLEVIKRVLLIPSIHQIHVLLGSAYQALATIEAICITHPRIKLHHNLTAEAIRSLMEQCGVAICPPSSVSYEYCAVKGLCFLKQTAGNQIFMLQYLTLHRLAFHFDAIEEVLNSADKYIDESIRNQATHFNNHIEENLRALVHNISLTTEYPQIRKATPADLDLYFEWANDPEVRKNAFHPDPISLEQHKHWFSRKLSDPSTLLYVCEYKGIPIGQVRVDLEGQDGVISYSIDKNHRGKGIGKILIRLLIEFFMSTFASKYLRLIAKVKPENIPSIRVFNGLGFKQTNKEQIHNVPALVFTYELKKVPLS
jgi:UDP-2,4-diacetamido-2,4,6-trideoxy-beta-L-altropyranose hydrolase